MWVSEGKGPSGRVKEADAWMMREDFLTGKGKEKETKKDKRREE